MADPAIGAVAREDAASLIAKIGVTHPELRAECLEILRTQLRGFAPDDYALNGFLIASLLDLNGVEAIEDIRTALAAGAVDETICGDLRNVEEELGLRPRETPARTHLRPTAPRVHAGAKQKAPRSGPNARERAEARKKKRKQAKKHR